MRKSLYTFPLCVVLFFVTGSAQEHSLNRRAQQAFEKAGSQLKNRQYALAVASLESAVALDPDFAAAHQQLGDIYRRQRDYEKAIPHYSRVIQLNPALTPLTWFGLGESLLHTGNYQEALPALRNYAAIPGLDASGKRLTNKYIADCEFSLSAQQHPLDFHPVNPGPAINTEYDEYFPKLTADHRTIIFTRKVNERESFYESSLDSNGKWQPARFLEGDINSAQYNEGAHCISADGKYLFFTGCNRPNGLGSCDIYVSRREGDRWGEPYNLGEPINSAGWEAQPALGADGKTLYFVSNRSGGQGGYDIWKSTLQSNGQWGDPQNLGPAINTPFDESSPYIHADNRTLYFVSNGWPGFGDKDIFKSQMDADGHWPQPNNLGYPINDHREQSALTVSMNGRYAFFSSRRPDALGGLDIYSFELPEASRPNPVAYLKGAIVDSDSDVPIQAEITVTDILTNEPLYQESADYEDGTFLAPLPFGKTYALHVKHPGYLFFSKNYPLDDSTKINDAYEIRIALSPIKIGNKETLNNIFFETNQYELLPQSKSDLDNLIDFLQLNKEVRIEIGGHTDDTGSDAYNRTLSENRAKAVHDYLIHAGIAVGRLHYKGYGPSQPIAGNDTEEGRQLNRRTDFKIIK
ncbi:PD40 domain-containing protein [Parapedobacter sp. ISTM3]|uniref:WD40-like Beta Propeller Repeat n=1 Tax=Parapedobacter luteus TaxID=623280 RepID=A0A1T5AZ08_9SPHI|nr:MULTISPECIES: OmpA family protein [Parapedobacter]MBK1440374.1 PD40 domain-containing protein [Parapedobacter sp. ISTM3]SKB40059.1 WD40-like Beta Propeller Repeat [Parapedobacter luteus]